MTAPDPKCYIPKFMEISPVVPEKKILKVFIIYGRGDYLGHMTNIILTHFHFLVHVPKSLHTNFGLNLASGF